MLCNSCETHNASEKHAEEAGVKLKFENTSPLPGASIVLVLSLLHLCSFEINRPFEYLHHSNVPWIFFVREELQLVPRPNNIYIFFRFKNRWRASTAIVYEIDALMYVIGFCWIALVFSRKSFCYTCLMLNIYGSNYSDTTSSYPD